MTTNKKLAPGTILHTFTRGRVDGPSPGEHAFPFGFKNIQQARVLLDDKVLKLTKVIEEHKVEHIYNHPKFTKGVVPEALVPKKSFRFLPNEDIGASFRDVQQAAERSPGIEMLWIVAVASSKITPLGVAFSSRGR